MSRDRRKKRSPRLRYRSRPAGRARPPGPVRSEDERFGDGHGDAGGARVRRRPRDWVVDTLLFLAAVSFALLVIGGRLESATPPPGWLFTADVAAGAVGCAGL